MFVSEAFRGVVDESVESIELAPGANGFHLGRRNSSPGGISSWKRCGVQLNLNRPGVSGHFTSFESESERHVIIEAVKQLSARVA